MKGLRKNILMVSQVSDDHVAIKLQTNWVAYDHNFCGRQTTVHDIYCQHEEQ
jgi:hypothetical protein